VLCYFHRQDKAIQIMDKKMRRVSKLAKTRKRTKKVVKSNNTPLPKWYNVCPRINQPVMAGLAASKVSLYVAHIELKGEQNSSTFHCGCTHAHRSCDHIHKPFTPYLGLVDTAKSGLKVEAPPCVPKEKVGSIQ
jgi:hypothetical protein